MKKTVLFISMLAIFAATSCETTEESGAEYAILTFEDADYAGTESSYWSSLIDASEYGGSLLYSTTSQYSWEDTDNTFLSGVANAGDVYDENWNSEAGWSFSEGGIAVSNYYMATASDSPVYYTNQLSVSNGSAGAAGNNGSASFAVAYDAGYGEATALTFADGTARTIDHLYISTTSYLEYEALYDDSNSLGDDSYFSVTATGYDADDVVTGTVTYYLAKDGALVSGWNKWDLSSLGDVVKVGFTVDSDVQNEWGVLLPTYFAIDDVTVVL